MQRGEMGLTGRGPRCAIERHKSKEKCGEGRRMPNAYFATGDPGKAFTWDDARSFPSSWAPGRGVVTTRYTKTSVPAVHGVDIAAELLAVRRILAGLHADDAILIGIASAGIS